MELLRPRRRRRIKCFPSGEAGRLGFNTLPPRSRPINVAKIVGTVDRCDALTPEFLPKKERERSARFRSIMRAMESDVPLPPIEVYQLGREYYVIDGHHRVASAISRGLAYIDAIVTSVVLPDTTQENQLHNRRIFFARRTGLQHAEFSQPESYNRALALIDAYAAASGAEGLSYAEAARHWYERTYQPFCRRVESSGILEHFPGETAGDIVLRLYDYSARETAARGEEIDLEDALADFETRYPPASLSARVLGPVSHTLNRAMPHRRRRK